MSPQRANLIALEGQRVNLALVDGSRIDDCRLVSAPRRSLHRVWLCVGDSDVFLPASSISDVWEAS